MHPHLKSLLVKSGCAADATDDNAQKFYDGMSADKKAEIDSALAAMMDSDGDDDGDTAATSARQVPPPPGTAIDVPATLSANQRRMVREASKIAVQSVMAATGAQQNNTQIGNSAASDGDRILALETRRCTQITQLGALLKVQTAVIQACIGKNLSVEDSRVAMLEEVHRTAKPVASVRVGDDKQITSLAAAIPQAMLLRAGIEPAAFDRHGEKLHDRARELAGMGRKAMFCRYIAALGATEIYEFGDQKLAECLGPRGIRRHIPRIAALSESTSDFGSITLDAQNKSLRFFYLDAKRTWPIWCEKKFAPDFKNINRVVLSEAPSMVSRTEGGELTYGVLRDSKEVYVLGEYAVGLRLMRRTILNDDQDAFTSIPRLQANAAARLEDDTAYAMITNNANMADGGALFNATAYTIGGSGHQNYTSSGGPPSVASLQTGSTAIVKQKGLNNVARLELEGKFLLVPSSIKEQTVELIGSKTLIAQYTGGSGNPTVVGDTNPFFNRYQVVGSTRLDDNSTTAWYMMADYRDGQVNTCELAFLTDEPEPIIRQETDFDSEDIKFLCRHTVAGKPIDFRGIYKNNGA